MQQVGSGAQQVAAGAQHDGAGSEHGSGQQAFRFLKQSNNPASADAGVKILVMAIATASVITFCINEFSEGRYQVNVSNTFVMRVTET